MEIMMFQSSKSWGRVAAVAGVMLLSACGMENRQVVSSPPPPPATAQASAYQVVFDPGSYTINLAGQRAIGDVATFVNGNNKALVTIVGRTDATGSAEANVQLSKERALAVRDALVATGKIDPTHIDTTWTGEELQDVGTNNGVPESGNRVTDIYIQ
jgi:outer membrane protein OmpA-like peptidoglycan-associated protein